MGANHSNYAGQTGLIVSDREQGGSIPDLSMIEPVPDGLEHVVYPKYEEAFRLGWEAFNNRVRVNKFYRPLPHILGSSEFQKDSHAGIVPAPDPPRSSVATTPRQMTSGGYRRPLKGVQGYRGVASALSSAEIESQERGKKRTRSMEQGNDWKAAKQSATLEYSSAHHSYADLEAVRKATSKASSEDEGPASEADAEGFVRSTKLNPASSVQALGGGLFDADEAMSSALEDYRLSHQAAPKSSKSPDAPSTGRSHLARTAADRPQISMDLQELGRKISDLHKAARTNES